MTLERKLWALVAALVLLSIIQPARGLIPSVLISCACPAYGAYLLWFVLPRLRRTEADHG
jgi:hypothetical protein